MCRSFYLFVVVLFLLLWIGEVIVWIKLKCVLYRLTALLIWAVKCCRSVFFGPVEVRLVDVFKVIVGLCGFKVFVCRVYVGDYVFVFAPSEVGIFMLVCVFKCNSVRMLFVDFSVLKLRLWGGYLWSVGRLLHCW